MHRLGSTPITADCFELDDYENLEINGASHTMQDDIDYLITFLEDLRRKYNETKDIQIWKELVRWLPESWLQTRTWTCNYENLFAIVRQREAHKLTEWRTFIKWVETLPYSKQLIFNKSEFH